MNPKLSTLRLPALLLASFFTAHFASAATVSWNGAGTNSVPPNTNWSSSVNWTGGTPAAANLISFTNAGASTVVSSVDNIVDANTTILTLLYGNTVGFHTTLINPGVTLTVTNIAAGNLLFVGTAADSGVSEILSETITGAGGTLVLANTNVGSQVVVQQGSSTTGTHSATMNMAGLDNLSVMAGRLLVAGNPITTQAGSNYLGGTLILAKTNVIVLNGTTTPVLNIADAVSNGNTTTNALQLGQTNSLYADTITIGHAKSIGVLQFNPAFAGKSPALLLNGKSSTRVATLIIGDDSSQATSSSGCNGTVDLSLGTMNAFVNVCNLGKGQTSTGSGSAVGTLSLGTGTFNVNTLNLGYVTSNTALARVVGTVNVNAGGTLVVNTNLAMGLNPGASATATANLNITNGTVLANSITNVGGTVASTINMVGGTLVVSNFAGTVAAPITTLAVSNSALTLNLVASAPSMVVGSGGITFNGTADTINFSAVPASTTFPKQFPVISYAGGGLNGAFDFNLGVLPAPYLGYISNNTGNSSIDLVITNVNVKLDVWNGNVNGNWDTTTLNWLYGGGAAAYHTGDFVQFDDTLAGTPNVILPANLSPGTLVVSNATHNYVFSGSGALTGSLGLTKYGADTLTLAETGGDNFSGGILANAGTVILDETTSSISGGLTITTNATVQIGNNDGNGALPSGPLTDNGTLAFSKTGAVTMATIIGGTGGLTQNGSGTLTLSANNGYSGPTTVLQGTLALGVASAVANSSQVNVNNGTLDLSAVTGTTTLTTLTALNLTNATLKLGEPYVKTAVTVSSLNAGGTANTINVSALPPMVSFPTTVTLLQSAGGISGANFVLGTLPSASPAYAGTLSVSGDQTAIYLTVNSGPVGVRPSVIWSGGDANIDTNWTDALNWQEPGAPVGSDNVIFSDAAAQYGSALNGFGSGVLSGNYVNNYVNQNFTVASLTYTNVNNDYQNTLIASGTTLTVTNSSTNSAGIVSVGSSSTSFGTSGAEAVTIAGPNATLNVNNTNATFFVGLGAGSGGGQQAILDLSGLSTFVANVNLFDVGASSNSALYISGVTYLAETNIITANGGTVNEAVGGTESLSLLVGETTSTSGANTSYLYLGQSNVFNVNSVGAGLSKNSGEIQFNPALSGLNPTAVFRFSDGVSPVADISIGDGLGQQGASTSPSGTIDFTGGTVDVLATTVYVGKSPNISGGRSSSGTLIFGAGTINVGNLYDGYQAYSNSDYAVGMINANGPGTLNISGTLFLAQTTGGPGGSGTSGTLSVNNATVLAGSIVAGALANGSDSTLTVYDGTLAVTNFAGTALAPIQYFTAGDSVINLGVGSSAPTMVVDNLSVNSSTNNTINILSLPPIYSYPAVIPLIGYASYGMVSATDFVLGNLPAATPAYAGSYVTNDTVDNTIDLVIASGPVGVSPVITWSGANSGVDINWSDALNWVEPGAQGAPLSSQSVVFNDLGAAATASVVDNIANNNSTILSLQFGNTNNFHTTQINPGVTVTVSNNAAGNLIFVGTGTDNGTAQTVTTTILGAGGTLQVVSTNAASEVQVQQGSGTAGIHTATLDLSGLGTFDMLAGRLLVAGDPILAAGASNYLGGTMILARTNLIQLSATNSTALNLSDAISNGNSTTNALELGTVNALYADTITVARSKSIGVLQFNPAVAGTGPSLYLRGTSAPRVAALAIGDDSNTGTTTFGATGIMDLSLGSVDALVNNCYVARGQVGTSSGTAVGTLTLGAGIFNVNTLTVGTVSINTAVANSTGTVNVNAGSTLVVNSNLLLAVNPGATATANATLNITNGTVLASVITAGTGIVNSTVNLAGGSLVVSNTAGAPGAPLTALNLTGGSLHLNVNGSVSLTNIVATSVAASLSTTVVLDSLAGVATSTLYPLISYAGADPAVNLALGTLPAGYTGALVDNAGAKLISIQFSSIPGQTPPVINSVTAVGGNLVFSGINGSASGTYYVLTSTNLISPLTNWTRLATNTFDAGGTFSVTTAINPAMPKQFYLISK